MHATLPSGFFVTGTDTGVGKTLASAAMLHALRGRGLRAIGMKPVASGCEFIDGMWRNEDATTLQRASEPAPAYADVNPFALPLPLAPELAAREAGVAVSLEPMLAAHGRLRAQCDVVVVEGVGGWMAPLSSTLMQSDLVRALDVPVVLVVGMRLGCLNHAYLTARAIEADHARLVGWIATGIDPDMARADENFALLSQRIQAPCIGRLPHDPAPDAMRMSRHIAWPEWPAPRG